MISVFSWGMIYEFNLFLYPLGQQWKFCSAFESATDLLQAEAAHNLLRVMATKLVSFGHNELCRSLVTNTPLFRFYMGKKRLQSFAQKSLCGRRAAIIVHCYRIRPPVYYNQKNPPSQVKGYAWFEGSNSIWSI